MKELRQYWTSQNPNRQTTKYIVIHHAAAEYRLGDAVRAIYDFHRGKWPKYNAAGYHIICQRDSDRIIRPYLVNPPNMIGAGVANMNDVTFHICAATNFGDRTPSKEWLGTLKEGVAYAVQLYPNAEIVGHKDITRPGYATACPGSTWPKWKDQIMTNIVEYPIIGGKTVDAEVLRKALDKYSNHLTEQQKRSIVFAYCCYGELTELGNIFPFAQAVHETGWFASQRFMRSYNPAGLGATDDGAWGSTFDTIAAGVIAQYAHLLCYAKPEIELTWIQKQIAELSPRRDAMRRAYGLGAANNNWHGLTHKWNTPKPEGKNYATRIIDLTNRITTL